MTIEQYQISAKRADLIQDGAGRGGGRVHARRRTGAGRVRGERDARIAGGRYHKLFRACQHRARDSGGQASSLERSGGIRAFVLDPELVETLARADSLDFEQRRPTLAECDGVLAFAEWQPL